MGRVAVAGLWMVAAAMILAGCGKPESQLAAAPGKEAPAADKGGKAVRAGVINGMKMTGLWDKVTEMFQAESGYKVETVVAGMRNEVAQAMRDGKLDFATLPAGDAPMQLVADGVAVNMTPWTRNEFVIVGPASDPAKIRGMTDGAAALRKIADTKSKFVDFQSIGTREITDRLWKKAGVPFQGDWVLKDETKDAHEVLEFARQHDAYVVVGRAPVLFQKLASEKMEIMVDKDPEMQRAYVALEANPARFPDANSTGARAMTQFLVSDKVQKFLATFGTEKGGEPPFLPVKPVGSPKEASGR